MILNLLDTNTAIYFFKGQGKVAERLFACPPRSIAISTIVLYELRTGIAKSEQPARRLGQLQALVGAVTLLPFAEEEAQAAAEIRAVLEKKGTPIGPYDVLIAATALANQATLITRNLREFRRVPGLQVSDWYE